jgi:hypothetical protein
VTLLKSGKGFFILFDRRFKLFDVFSTTFTECRLSLTIPLFTFFRRGINLDDLVDEMGKIHHHEHTGFLPPLRF